MSLVRTGRLCSPAATLFCAHPGAGRNYIGALGAVMAENAALEDDVARIAEAVPGAPAVAALCNRMLVRRPTPLSPHQQRSPSLHAGRNK